MPGARVEEEQAVACSGCLLDVGPLVAGLGAEGTLREHQPGHARPRPVTRPQPIPPTFAISLVAATRACSLFPPRRSMVRRGSPVRVRKRASQKASKCPFLLPEQRTPIAQPSSTCPQDLSPTSPEPRVWARAKASDFIEHLPLMEVPCRQLERLIGHYGRGASWLGLAACGRRPARGGVVIAFSGGSTSPRPPHSLDHAVVAGGRGLSNRQ
jgi:hypothetical protein